MKKVEAATLDKAYEIAASELQCSITDLEYEVIQYPSEGFLGLFKKRAIIVATSKSSHETESSVNDKRRSAGDTSKVLEENRSPEITFDANDTVSDESFEAGNAEEEKSIVYNELAQLIERELKELLSHSCFDIDVVEVDVRDNMALIFIDGEDAALLIGKEGYRYNALSYMLFNWLHTKYELYIKLEIAEFLTTQHEMIRNYIKPVIENVYKHGRGRTPPLDGILVQIALEQLREEFHDKYVAVKVDREGNRFIVINDFNSKRNG